MHQTVKCICGITISNCRCIGPKQLIIQKPCTHKKTYTAPSDSIGQSIGGIIDNIVDIFT